VIQNWGYKLATSVEALRVNHYRC